MNKLLLPIMGALSLFALPAIAQDTPTSKPNAIAPYKTAIGYRASVGGPTGIQHELRIKRFVKPEAALELQVGRWGHRESYQASLHYLWQPQLLTSSRLRPYAGVGIGAVGTTRGWYYEKQPLKVGAILLASVGVEYAFQKIPLAVSLDYRHAVLGVNTDSYSFRGFSYMNTLGLGLKYTIGK
ncbi:hypothetical protein PKOR_06755 [Pontibacter korlensis]|uniref:Outer membrane protein beta-barrel domain-containing protein n=1 Tax=Pontibacter korlensis TaxID=400092 RepID=A0A0E3UZR2_9BACT|nr:hypothetical protein PKOR_06755 [Pontibacter korlensis]